MVFSWLTVGVLGRAWPEKTGWHPSVMTLKEADLPRCSGPRPPGMGAGGNMLRQGVRFLASRGQIPLIKITPGEGWRWSQRGESKVRREIGPLKDPAPTRDSKGLNPNKSHGIGEQGTDSMDRKELKFSNAKVRRA